MSDEEYDKMIKEAADQYHPAYEDAAWKKMERLLNEHLPVEKEKKRFFFLLPLLLLLGGLVFFIILYTGKTNNSEISQNADSKNKTEEPVSAKVQHSNKSTGTAPSNESVAASGNEKTNAHKNVSATEAASSKIQFQISSNEDNLISERTDSVNAEDLSITNKNHQIHRMENVIAFDKKPLPENNNIIMSSGKENNEVAPKASDKKIKTSEQNPAKTEEEKATARSQMTKKTKGGFARNFSISLSAGPDISGVHIKEAGKITIAYGVGIGYAISKRFGIRAGFYISNKIYSAGPEDYQLAGNPQAYEYLENIEANCKVYEIPLKVDYNFKAVKNHHWFISTGLSSYLMKRETYDYYYKTPNGVAYNKDWTIKNKNQHFLSVLNLSGGYQYSINKQFSLAAEPYVEIPLAGVGAGKVKLNSGGILFTIKAKTFFKKGK